MSPRQRRATSPEAIRRCVRLLGLGKQVRVMAIFKRYELTAPVEYHAAVGDALQQFIKGGGPRDFRYQTGNGWGTFFDRHFHPPMNTVHA